MEGPKDASLHVTMAPKVTKVKHAGLPSHLSSLADSLDAWFAQESGPCHVFALTSEGLPFFSEQSPMMSLWDGKRIEGLGKEWCLTCLKCKLNPRNKKLVTRMSEACQLIIKNPLPLLPLRTLARKELVVGPFRLEP